MNPTFTDPPIQAIFILSFLLINLCILNQITCELSFFGFYNHKDFALETYIIKLKQIQLIDMETIFVN